MLNREFISKLADFIKGGSLYYDQSSWDHCIAAQACAMAGQRSWHRDNGRIAQRLIGIDGEQYNQLFHGGPMGTKRACKADAVRVLHRLAATGEVDWSAKPEPAKEPEPAKAELPPALTDALQAKPKARAKAKSRELADA